MSAFEYSEVVQSLSTYYGTSSQAIWDVINSYDLTPQQAAELLPKDTLAQSADGLYRVYDNVDHVTSYVNKASVSTNNSQQLIPLDSNKQLPAVETTYQTKWAGNSVIDQNGKVKTEPSVNKYENGSLLGKVGTVLAYGSAAVSGWSVGMSLGKFITSSLYNADPTFFSCYSPENWNSITADLGDTGIEGLGKKVINYLLQINPDGSTQAYLPEDAYKSIAYGLAKTGLFDEGGIQYPVIPSAGDTAYRITGLGDVLAMLGGRICDELGSAYRNSFALGLGNATLLQFISQYELFNIRVDSGYIVNIEGWKISNGSYVDKTFTISRQTINGIVVPYLSVNDLQISGASHSYIKGVAVTTDTPATWSKYYGSNTGAIGWNRTGNTNSSTLFTSNINVSQETALPGVSDQTGATTPSGISSSSSKSQVDNAIDSQFPDLENNRIEQTVVQPNGTTRIIKYYPVPMPSSTTETTTTEPKTMTLQDALDVVLPDGSTITLPDGTTVTGDGVKKTTLPAGTYTLPTGTVITNFISSDDAGGTQQSKTVTNQSSDTSKKLVTKLITEPNPQTGTDVEPDTTNRTNDKTTDMGDGSSPPIIIPTGTCNTLFAVYNPTDAELNSFGSWLWSSNFIDQLLKMFNDPMQAIIGLHKIFVTPTTGAVREIQVGYLNSQVNSKTVTNQYTTVDCGNINLFEYFGNVFDYSPYTRAYVFLPFIGFKELDVSQVMRSTLNIKYHVDVYTGTCLVEISVIRDAGAGGILYTFSGDCAVRYPLSQGSYMGIVNAIAGLAVGIGGALTGAGGLGAIGGLSMFQHARTNVEHSGSFSGNSGAMGCKKPYLVIMRPQTAMPDNYRHYSGDPSSAYVAIGNTTGLIRVRECHIDSISIATKEEKLMIETALKEGVIV